MAEIIRWTADNIAIGRGLISAYVVSHDLDGALSAIRDMQLHQPKDPQLYQDRAAIQIQNKQPKDAIESLQRLIELQPMNPAPRRDLALLQEKTGALRGRGGYHCGGAQTRPRQCGVGRR